MKTTEQNQGDPLYLMLAPQGNYIYNSKAKKYIPLLEPRLVDDIIKLLQPFSTPPSLKPVTNIQTI